MVGSIKSMWNERKQEELGLLGLPIEIKRLNCFLSEGGQTPIWKISCLSWRMISVYKEMKRNGKKLSLENWRSPGFVKDSSTLNAGNSAVHLEWAHWSEGLILASRGCLGSAQVSPVTDLDTCCGLTLVGNAAPHSCLFTSHPGGMEVGNRRVQVWTFVSWVHSSSLKKKKKNKQKEQRKKPRNTRDSNHPQSFSASWPMPRQFLSTCSLGKLLL